MGKVTVFLRIDLKSGFCKSNVMWCRRRGSNPHARKGRRILSPPIGTGFQVPIRIYPCFICCFVFPLSQPFSRLLPTKTNRSKKGRRMLEQAHVCLEFGFCDYNTGISNPVCLERKAKQIPDLQSYIQNQSGSNPA